MVQSNRSASHPVRLLLLTSLSVAAALLPTRALSQAAAPAPKPEPDKIVFTNGDVLTGKLTRGTNDTILFHSDIAGDITVPLSKVKELKAGGSFAVLRKDVPLKTKALEAKVPEGNIVFAGDHIEVHPPNKPIATVPVPEIAYMIDQGEFEKAVKHEPGFFHAWAGSATAGATLVRSTQNSTTFTGAISLVRAIPIVPYLPARNRTTLNFTQTYGTLTAPTIPPVAGQPISTTTKTNIFHGDTERDEYFSPRFYYLGTASFDHNFSQGLNLQEIYGGGFGWTAVKDAKQELDVKAEIQYEKQYFQTPDANQNLIGSTFAENYTRQLPRKLSLTENANFIPAWNNTTAYSANATVILGMPIYKKLSATFTGTDNYLNNPAQYYKKNSLQLVLGVTYAIP